MRQPLLEQAARVPTEQILKVTKHEARVQDGLVLALPDGQKAEGERGVQFEEGLAELHAVYGAAAVQRFVQAALPQGLEQQAGPVDGHDGEGEVLLGVARKPVQREAEPLPHSLPFLPTHVAADANLGGGASQVEEAEQAEHAGAAEVRAGIVALREGRYLSIFLRIEGEKEI